MSDGLIGELVDPDVDVVDHDRCLAGIFSVIDTEQVEAGDCSTVDGQPASGAVGDRNGLPYIGLLAQCLEDSPKIDMLAPTIDGLTDSEPELLVSRIVPTGPGTRVELPVCRAGPMI